MKTKYLFIPVLIFAFTSCNIIGNKVKEIPLQADQIMSAENIPLKKGDEIILWTKMDAEYEEAKPDFSIKYLVQKDGQPLKFDSIRVMNGTHIIKSFYKEGKDGRTTWNFEIENGRINIPEDGKYSFDFKLYEINDDFPHDEVAMILRKK